MRKLSEFDYKLDTYTSNDQILEDLRENFGNCQIFCVNSSFS